MRHGVNAHPFKLGDWIIQFPSFLFFLQRWVGCEVLEGEKVFFGPDECEHFDSIINFFPGNFGTDAKLESSPILELNLEFIYGFVGSVLAEAVNFA